MEYTAQRQLSAGGGLSLRVTLSTPSGIETGDLWTAFAKHVEDCVSKVLMPPFSSLEQTAGSSDLHEVRHRASYEIDGITVKYKLEVKSVVPGDLALCELARDLHRLSHLPHLLELAPMSDGFRLHLLQQNVVTTTVDTLTAVGKRLFPAFFPEQK